MTRLAHSCTWGPRVLRGQPETKLVRNQSKILTLRFIYSEFNMFYEATMKLHDIDTKSMTISVLQRIRSKPYQLSDSIHRYSTHDIYWTVIYPEPVIVCPSWNTQITKTICRASVSKTRICCSESRHRNHRWTGGNPTVNASILNILITIIHS